MKTKEQIRAETKPIPRPADWEYGKKLEEWESALPPGTENLLLFDPVDDRIIVKLLDDVRSLESTIALTDTVPLIGGECRKALVLKCGPGKWIQTGQKWWRRPMVVHSGMIVYIGNWVDLEGNGLALCQEGDVRVWQH